MNFLEVPIGTSIGSVSPNKDIKLIVHNENEQDVSDIYFHVENNEIKTLRDVMPAMLTLNEEIIKQDCLCYLMERVI